MQPNHHAAARTRPRLPWWLTTWLASLASLTACLSGGADAPDGGVEQPPADGKIGGRGGGNASSGGDPGDFDHEDTLEPWRSGTRLRARVIDAGDGALVFAGWFDTELMIDCRFRLHADGLARCVPQNAAADSFGFSDPDCRNPVVFFPAEPDTIVATSLEPIYNDARCAPPPLRDPGQFHRVVGPHPEDAPLFQQVGDACMEIASLFPPGSAPPMTELAPLSPDDFVVARMEQSDGPIGARWFAGSDGSHETVTLLTADSHDCDLLDTPSMAPSCLVANIDVAVSSDLFTDPACTMPSVLLERSSPCGIAELAIGPAVRCANARGGSGKPTELFAVSEWDGTAALYQRYIGPDECTALQLAGALRQPNTQALPERLMPPPLEVAERGSGRLRARFGVSSDGRLAHNPVVDIDDDPAHGYLFYDTLLDEHCEVRSTRATEEGIGADLEGELRCLPAFADPRSEVVYLDDACTQPAVLAVPGNCAAELDDAPVGFASEFVVADDPEWREPIVTHVLRPTSGELVKSFFARFGDSRELRCEPVEAIGLEGARPTIAVPIAEFAPIELRLE